MVSGACVIVQVMNERIPLPDYGEFAQMLYATCIISDPWIAGKERFRLNGVILSEEQAAQLNEAYICHQRTGRPFVHLKLACSLDGKIATRAGDSQWITGATARRRVHELRHAADAILCGAGPELLRDAFRLADVTLSQHQMDWEITGYVTKRSSIL